MNPMKKSVFRVAVRECTPPVLRMEHLAEGSNGIPREAKQGDLLHLTDRHGKVLGTAYFGIQHRSIGWIVAVRALESLDLSFFAHKFQNAFAKRIPFLKNRKTTVFRVFHSEGDGIGGITVDFYDGNFLISYYSEGIYAYREEIRAAIAMTADLETIVEKKRFGDDPDGEIVCIHSNHSRREKEDPRTSERTRKKAKRDEASPADTKQAQTVQTHTPTEVRTQAEAAQTPVQMETQAEAAQTLTETETLTAAEKRLSSFFVLENDIRCRVNLIHGGMTGIFADQREVRKSVRNRYAKGKTVLNLFSYTALFSVFAAKGGAKKTTNVDLAKRSHEIAKENFRYNGLDESEHEFIEEDVFQFLKKSTNAGKQYDLIIIDPPSFSNSSAGVFSSEKGMEKLIIEAKKVASRAAVMVISTNNSRISVEKMRAVTAAHGLELLEEYSLPADYRTKYEAPYLKVLIARIRT